MSLKTILSFLAVFSLSACVTPQLAQTEVRSSINQQELSKTLDQVVDWQIAHFSYKEKGNLHDYGLDAWTNSVLYLGLAQWAEHSPKSDEIYAWLYQDIGEKNQWQIPANFKNYPKYSLYHADELAIAQFYTRMYLKYGEDKMLKATKERLDWIMSSQPNEAMIAHNKQMWSWCDALFMAPPVYAALAKLYKDETYLSYMHKRFLQTYHHLYDIDEKLFFRDSSYFNQREANGEKVFWGRGNGWVVAGICNILDWMPEQDARRGFYIDLYRVMMNRLLELRDEQGYWHASLLDSASYPAPETSATAMITYALAYGINKGILAKEIYLPTLEQSWQALVAVVSDEGKLGFVQPIGADPKKVTEDMTAVYGVGAFLLAGNEIYKLTNEEKKHEKN